MEDPLSTHSQIPGRQSMWRVAQGVAAFRCVCTRLIQMQCFYTLYSEQPY